MKGCRKHCMPKIAEDKSERLSETKTTGTSNIIAVRIFTKPSAERAERKIGASQSMSFFLLSGIFRQIGIFVLIY